MAYKTNRSNEARFPLERGGPGEGKRRTLPGELAHSLYAQRAGGGLGILDLERLARALRLRWYWYKWKDNGRPWSSLDIPTDNTDRALFNA
jgi:hypothetical protein